MPEIKIHVTGMKELLDNLSDFGAKIQYQAGQSMVAAGAKFMQREVQERCPVDTGQLRRSIRVVKMSKARAPITEYGVTNYSGEKYGKENDGWYGHIVEFGSFKHPGGYEIKLQPSHGKKVMSGGQMQGTIYGTKFIHPPMRAKPFFRPAWDETKHTMFYHMKNHLAKSVQRYKKRAAIGAARIANAP